MLMYVSHSLADNYWTRCSLVAKKGIWKATTQIKRNEVSLNLLTLLNDDDDDDYDYDYDYDYDDAGGARSPMFTDDSPFDWDLPLAS